MLQLHNVHFKNTTNVHALVSLIAWLPMLSPGQGWLVPVQPCDYNYNIGCSTAIHTMRVHPCWLAASTMHHLPGCMQRDRESAPQHGHMACGREAIQVS